MSGHSLGYEHGMAMAACQLADPGDGGTVYLEAGTGFGLLHITAAGTNTVVLPDTANSGTMILIVNDSGGTLAINTSGGNALDADLADGGTELCIASDDTWSSVELTVAS